MSNNISYQTKQIRQSKQVKTLKKHIFIGFSRKGYTAVMVLTQYNNSKYLEIVTYKILKKSKVIQENLNNMFYIDNKGWTCKRYEKK